MPPHTDKMKLATEPLTRVALLQRITTAFSSGVNFTGVCNSYHS